MRPFFPVLCFFVLGWSGSAAARPGDAVAVPACVVTTARPAPEPPAWQLLAGAVLLLGAGRLAAS